MIRIGGWLKGSLLGIFCLLAGTVAAQTPAPPEPWGDRITLEIWSIADRIVHGETPVEERLLQEAQATLSAMVYGYDFIYTPEYPARGVERYFKLTPVGEIRWGDPRLRIRDLRDERTTLYALIDYELSPNDRARLEAWRSAEVETGAGGGSAALREGYTGKIEALEEAIARSIRDYLRHRYFNRPREVTGTVVLREPPRFRTVSGTYEARVLVSIRITEVIPWVTF
ncbi:MAG: hypothetical protein ACOCYQ_09460 [Alkalispirochaeta sp.]